MVVELLAEKIESLSKVQALSDRDPLAAAWYAAEAAELFSRSIRGAIVRYRANEETEDFDPAELTLESAIDAPEVGEPASQLSTFQRELLEEFSRLSPEKLEAMRTLMKR